MIQLKDLCQKASSNIAQKDLEGHEGQYPIYGASGLIGYVDFYKQENPYVAVVKDGAGIGRVMCLPEKSSVIGTMQYILPNEGVNVHYLAFAMEHMNLAKYFSGATIPHIYFKDYGKEKLLERTEKEQKSIAEILNKMDSLISLRKQQIAKLDELVKARFVEMFGDDIYPKVKVSRVCDFITKGTTPPNNLISEKYSSDKVPYLKVYNLSFTGKLLFDTAPQYVPENIHNGVLARSKVYPNDVLMNIVGPPLGKFALVTNEFSEWNINQAIAIFRVKEKVNPKYLLFALMQPEVLKPFLRQAVGIRQLNLSLAQCRDLEIPLPPLSLQSEFAAFVERVDQQKQTVQQSLEKLELMKKALMQEYFG